MPRIQADHWPIAHPDDGVPVGRFKIYRGPYEGTIWISNNQHEGMETSAAKLEALLAEFWAREF